MYLLHHCHLSEQVGREARDEASSSPWHSSKPIEVWDQRVDRVRYQWILTQSCHTSHSTHGALSILCEQIALEEVIANLHASETK